MALADYRLCDICEGKTFYDANLDYEEPDKSRSDYPNYWLRGVGAWVVICPECAEAHQIIIQRKNTSVLSEDNNTN